MKIALISFEYPPETGYGGIGTYTWYQARALAKIGHEVHVLCGASKAMEMKTTEHDHVIVHRFRSEDGFMRTFRKLGRFQLWWTKNRMENAFSMYRAFRKLHKQHQYDIVEMPECGAEGLLINHFTGASTLIKFHSPSQLIMPFYDVRPSDIRFCSRLEQIGINGAKAYSSCSQFLANEAHEKLHVKLPIRVIPNGIDLDLFDSIEEMDIRKEFNIPRDRLMILFSGRMENRKGIYLCKEILPAVLEKYDVSFVFAGQDLFNYLNGTLIPYWQTKKFRGTFHHLGKLDQKAVRSSVRQTDIFLLPSLWENCPYSCLEAMAAGRAIVSSDSGGMPELIRHEQNGLLAINGDVDSFVRCLERLIEDSSLRQTIGSQARRTIERSFTDVHIARKSADYYFELLGGNAANPEAMEVQKV